MSISDYNTNKDLNVTIDGVQIDDGLPDLTMPFAIRTVMADLASFKASGAFVDLDVTNNITVGGTVDGRDVAADGSKLDGIEALADVTDATNVTAAGALMDSELTSIASVKAMNQGVATTDSPTFAGLVVNFQTRTAALAGTTGTATVITVGDLVYIYDASGTALTTGDARKWSPYGQAKITHYGAITGTDDDAVFALADAGGHAYIDLDGLTVATTVSKFSVVSEYFNGTLITHTSNGFDFPMSEYRRRRDFRENELQLVGTKCKVLTWAGTDVLWLGTSIPHQGTSVDSYPVLFGVGLDATVANWAWSGSRMAFDGVASGGEDDINTIKCLSMTEDDRLHGFATYGSSSVYDDSFDPVTKGSKMTVDFRIKAPFASTPFDTVILDHNHNDKNREIGTLTPESLTITGVTKGTTTVIAVSSAGTLAVQDAIALEIVGIDKLNYCAAIVTALSGTDVTINVNSSAYAGTFTSGTMKKLDRSTITGSAEFLIYYIRNMSEIYNSGVTKIIMAGAPSEYTNDVFDATINSTSVTLKALADKWGISFFDVAHHYRVAAADQVAYFPDDVHPSTLETRQALANLWMAWASGGHIVPATAKSLGVEVGVDIPALGAGAAMTAVLSDAVTAGNVSPTSVTGRKIQINGPLWLVTMRATTIDITGMTGANDLFFQWTDDITPGSYQFGGGNVVAISLPFVGYLQASPGTSSKSCRISENVASAAIDYITVTEANGASLYVNFLVLED